MEPPTIDQIATGAAWYATNSSITSLTLAVVLVVSWAFFIWYIKNHRQDVRENNERWTKALDNVTDTLKELFRNHVEMGKVIEKALQGVALQMARNENRRR